MAVVPSTSCSWLHSSRKTLRESSDLVWSLVHTLTPALACPVSLRPIKMAEMSKPLDWQALGIYEVDSDDEELLGTKMGIMIPPSTGFPS